MQLSFTYKKSVQALNYLALQADGKLNKMKALKLIYFADRYHLRKYGRPITNDTYFALPYGPVASACRNLLEGEDENYPTAESKYKQTVVQTISKYDYQSIAPIDNKVFSQTDIEALQYAWTTYSAKDQFQLAEETHQFPEWDKHAAALNSGQVSRRSMPYSDFLENPDEGVDHIPALTPEEQLDLKEEIDELHSIESVWS